MLPLRFRRRCVLPLLLLLLAPAAAQDRVPPLPHLALDTYPRPPVTRSHARITTRPRTTPTRRRSGTLGRVLHAWEQWDAAHAAYARAAGARAAHVRVAVPRRGRAAAAGAAVRGRRAGSKPRSSIDPDNLPARLRLAEALLDAGDLEESRPAVRGADRPGVRACRAVRPRAHRRRAGPARRGRRPTFNAPSRSSRSSGRPTTRWRCSYRALGRTEDARAALEAHARFGARWPAVADPVLATVTSLRDDAGALLQRGVKLADAGDVDGAIAAHEAALALDPSLAQAHANLISLYGRHAQLRRRRRSTTGRSSRSASTSRTRTTTTACCWGCRSGGTRRPTRTARRSRSIRCTPRRTTISARFSSGAASSRRRSPSIGWPLESQPTLRLARFNLGRMLIALGKPGRGARRAAEAHRAARRRGAALPVRAVRRVRAGRSQGARR